MGCKLSKKRLFRRNRSEASRDNEGGRRVHARNEERENVPNAKHEEYYASDFKRTTDNEAINELVQVGLDEEIANELVLLREKGSLKTTADVVAVLEKNNADYKLQLEDNILVKVNSLGDLSCEKVGEKVVINSGEKININTASKKSLEEIKGIGPTLAGRIIQYREENGPFKKVEDIVSVRGVSEKLLEKINSQITVESSETPTVPVITLQSNKTVRIASWNLLSFSSDKADNDGVREVVCRTILENGIDILAVQEIADKTALDKIKDELNNPTSEKVKNLKTHGGHWECCTSDVAGYMFRSREYNGFVWNTSRGINLKSDALLEKPKEGQKQFARRPYLGFFKAKKFDFVLVSVHLKATGLGNADKERLEKELARIPDLVQALQTHIPGEKDMMILGDFNLGPDEEEFNAMQKGGLENLIPGSTFTNISTKNMEGSKNYDNIWISKHAKLHHFTGQAGVVREGLTHPSIPDGWRWNGLVSDHCPVWAEFYCDRDFDKATGPLSVDDIVIDGKERT
ncbi:hypothetical protein ACROYT_G012390 [Oculina patagonica]